ncbi:TIGR03086 family metal-binding protein [Rhodococcus jostii]|uniref:TIGR03086 family protein n=1 Tax=Rhodococcus jostii TaxID=132919 RepID=A0A1H4IIF6_RHOJO|nr:TIGR03086 family metal-binding protein [Rhodococcus jostii]SEB33871.1 TIGR03086 family protein [Rhodococcus jostii]
MESSIAGLYSRVAQDFTDRLQGCPQDRWNSASPCPGWTAWDIAAHVVGNHRRACAGLSGDDYQVPAAGEDVVAAWLHATAEVQAALESETTARQALGVDFGDLPFEQFVRRMACADTLIHTWDFARATGQTERLDPEAVEVAWSFLAAEDAQIRLPHAYGAKIAATDSADVQTRLLNFLGRAV